MTEMLQYAYAIALLVAVGYGLYRAAVWAECDALRRGKSPLLVKCAVILFFPWGLIAWLIFRPQATPQTDQMSRTFHLNDFREQ